MKTPARTAPSHTSSALAELGLTPLESDVYRFLLSEPGATGYRVAQATGKAVGNIYKAIEALETKGATLVSDDNGSRVARAVPIREWIQARRAAFDRACAAASRGLETTESEREDEVLYRITSRDQAIERARSMLDGARQFALVTACPPLVPELADAIHLASRRIPVGVKVFDRCDIAGAEIVVDPRELAALEGGPGTWAIVNVDGRECFQALFSDDGETLQTASWSRNALLAWTHFTGLSSDFLLAHVRHSLQEKASAATIARQLGRLAAFETPKSAGKMAMARRYRAPARPSARLRQS